VASQGSASGVRLTISAPMNRGGTEAKDRCHRPYTAAFGIL